MLRPLRSEACAELSLSATSNRTRKSISGRFHRDIARLAGGLFTLPSRRPSGSDGDQRTAPDQH